jgi:hypothetical protein
MPVWYFRNIFAYTNISTAIFFKKPGIVDECFARARLIAAAAVSI